MLKYNNLVAIIPRQLDHESSLDIINQKQMTTLDVKRQIAGSPKMESLNLIKSNKWVNLFSLGQVVEEYSAVLKCPIDTLWDKGLQCDVTNIFGVRMNSFYFSRDSVYISSIYYPGSYYGVSAHSTEEYLQRNDHGVIVEDGAEVQSAFYRVDLDQGDVTAVLFDGSLLNLFSYQEIDDSFVAILKRSEDDEYFCLKVIISI